MRFDLSEEQELIRDTARRFLDAENPISFIRSQFDEPSGFSKTYWKKVADLGWLCMAAGEDAGGYSPSGKSGQGLSIIAEEMGRRVASGPFIPTGVVLQALSSSPDAGHRNSLIADILSGDIVTTWAFGEPGSRWDPSAITTTANLNGDEVELHGIKAYVEAGAEADTLLVTARSDLGLTQVLTPADARGVTIIPGRSLDFVRRFAEVRMDKVRLPKSAIVGEFGGAGAQVERQLQLALLLQCAETNGAVDRAFEFTVEYMRERYTFGRSIASYQALKHRLADILLWTHSGMAATDSGIEAFDNDSDQSARLSRVAKTYVGVKSTAIASDLVQLTGGIAVTWEHDLHLYERRIAVNRAVYGTPEQLRRAIHRCLGSETVRCTDSTAVTGGRE